MVMLAVVSVFGKLLARHVHIACWWERDKFFIDILLVCVPGNEKSNIALSAGFPLHNHWIFGIGEPPRTSHNNTISLPSSYGPANDRIISPRSFKIFGFCGGTRTNKHETSDMSRRQKKKIRRKIYPLIFLEHYFDVLRSPRIYIRSSFILWIYDLIS